MSKRRYDFREAVDSIRRVTGPHPDEDDSPDPVDEGAADPECPIAEFARLRRAQRPPAERLAALPQMFPDVATTQERPMQSNNTPQTADQPASSPVVLHGIVELPPILRPDGQLETTLRRTEHESSREPANRELHRRMKSDLDSIRRACGPNDCQPWRSREWADTNRCALLPIPLEASPPDSVLRFCVAFHEGFRNASDTTRQAAQQAYGEQKSAYDVVLAELIPTELVDTYNVREEREAYRYGTNPTAADDWPFFLDATERRRQDPLAAITTGIPGLDERLGGGLRGMTVLGGLPAIGKTSLALSMALAALTAHPELAVLILSFDMAKDTLYQRLRCHEAGIEWLTLTSQTISEEVRGRLERADARLRDQILGRLRIVEEVSLPESGFGAEWLLEAANQLAEVTQSRHVLIIVDNFQRLKMANATDELEADRARLDALKTVQDATRSETYPEGDPILVLSKVGKGDGPTNFNTKDLFGSSDLGSRPSCVMFLEEDKQRTESRSNVAPVVLSITKGRDGVDRSKIPLDFHFATYHFSSRGSTSDTPPSVAVDSASAAPQGRRPRRGYRGI